MGARAIGTTHDGGRSLILWRLFGYRQERNRLKPLELAQCPIQFPTDLAFVTRQLGGHQTSRKNRYVYGAPDWTAVSGTFNLQHFLTSKKYLFLRTLNIGLLA
jgi:hypothetical protein